jgi:hypothetical protein
MIIPTQNEIGIEIVHNNDRIIVHNKNIRWRIIRILEIDTMTFMRKIMDQDQHIIEEEDNILFLLYILEEEKVHTIIIHHHTLEIEIDGVVDLLLCIEMDHTMTIQIEGIIHVIDLIIVTMIHIGMDMDMDIMNMDVEMVLHLWMDMVEENEIQTFIIINIEDITIEDDLEEVHFVTTMIENASIPITTITTTLPTIIITSKVQSTKVDHDHDPIVVVHLVHAV